MTIINNIQSVASDLVYFTSAFTEHYTYYIAECNKPSKDYDHVVATQRFDRAASYARMAISTCEDAGLDPKVVCKDQINFVDSYKVAA